MDTVVFGLTTQQLLMAGGTTVSVLVLAMVIRAFLGRKKEDRHMQVVRCAACGWKGRVSRYAGRCPKCNQSLGDQLLRDFNT